MDWVTALVVVGGVCLGGFLIGFGLRELLDRWFGDGSP